MFGLARRPLLGKSDNKDGQNVKEGYSPEPSRLLQLPAEIRIDIWKLVLLDDRRHIYEMSGLSPRGNVQLPQIYLSNLAVKSIFTRPRPPAILRALPRHCAAHGEVLDTLYDSTFVFDILHALSTTNTPEQGIHKQKAIFLSYVERKWLGDVGQARSILFQWVPYCRLESKNEVDTGHCYITVSLQISKDRKNARIACVRSTGDSQDPQLRHLRRHLVAELESEIHSMMFAGANGGLATKDVVLRFVDRLHAYCAEIKDPVFTKSMQDRLVRQDDAIIADQNCIFCAERKSKILC